MEEFLEKLGNFWKISEFLVEFDKSWKVFPMNFEFLEIFGHFLLIKYWFLAILRFRKRVYQKERKKCCQISNWMSKNSSNWPRTSPYNWKPRGHMAIPVRSVSGIGYRVG